MDFITGLPKVQGKDCIYVVVDKLTKYAYFFPIAADYTASQVADVFFREIFRLHGLPKTIVSDRDRRFMSFFWQELFRLTSTELTPSTSYHPQTDGQTEIVNKWIEGYLRNYVAGQQCAWVCWLYLGEFCYNTTHHMSIDMSPFHALYGYDAMTFMDLALGDSRAPLAQDWLQENQEILKSLKENIQRAQILKSLQDYFWEFQERRVLLWHNGSSFLRLTWNPLITWVCSPTTIGDERGNVDFLEIILMALWLDSFEKQFPKELTEFMQYLIALLTRVFQIVF